jgi:hypothetical protein
VASTVAPSYPCWDALAHYLSARMRFERIILGWPDFNETLKLPAMSIHNRVEPIFQPGRKKLVQLASDNPVTDALFEIGDWVIELQIDIFNGTKKQRIEYQDMLFHIFNNQDDRMLSCLNLYLPNYHNRLATYHYLNMRDMDDETALTRSEWRTVLNVRVDAKAFIVRRQVPIIKETQVELDISEGPGELILGE